MSEIEKKMWRKVDRSVYLLRICPFVRMVAVCNNLAFGAVDEKSDIDLFIVAKTGRLFIARSFITIVLHIFGLRRHGDKVAGRFCLSFFVDDSFLNLSSIAIENDIYLAYWVKSMKPIIDDGVSVEFLYENLWAKRFFTESEDFVVDTSRITGTKSFFSKVLEKMLGDGFGDFLELKLKSWQLRRARKKACLAGESSSLIVEEHILKFHNVDRRREYRRLWIQRHGENAKLKRGELLFP